MKINLSDKIWTEKEKNEILERAVVYLSKQQGKKIAEPQKKVSCMQSNNKIPKKGFQNLMKTKYF